MTPDDQAFIISSWLKSFWAHNSMWHWIGSQPFHRHWHSRVEALARPGLVTIAAHPERTVQIFGWVCSSGPQLHYVYVKDFYRRQGVGTALLKARSSPRDCSFWTEYAEHLQDKLGWHYQPSRMGERRAG